MASAEQAMDGWWDSDGHRKNILRDGSEYGGMGYYQCEDGRWYFTQLFGQ